jgi:glycerate kinase
MSAPEAAAAIARGVQRAAKSLDVDIETDELPLSDGGADFVALSIPQLTPTPVASRLTTTTVSGHHDDRVDAELGLSIDEWSLRRRHSDPTFGTRYLLLLAWFPALLLVMTYARSFVWFVVAFFAPPIAWLVASSIASGRARKRHIARVAEEFSQGKPVATHAVLQLSSAAGLAQIPKDQRDPTRTSTYGVGQLILAALDQGVRDITIGVGNSATVDAGAGALAALGVKFFDQRDQPIERPTGGDLSRIARIDASSLDPRLKRTKITVACDVDNPLLGHDGAAPTFAPQKGASLVQVDELERGLANFVNVLRSAGFDPKPDATHTGAAGGFGFGLATVLGARLIPTIWLFTGYGWDEEFYPGPSLVLTGEGRIDAQTVRGKLPIAVAKEARAAGVPTIALVGSVGEGAEKTLDPAHASRPGGETDGGLLDYLVITPDGMPLDEALRRAPELLEAAAERAVRDWLARSQ